MSLSTDHPFKAAALAVVLRANGIRVIGSTERREWFRNRAGRHVPPREAYVRLARGFNVSIHHANKGYGIVYSLNKGRREHWVEFARCFTAARLVLAIRRVQRAATPGV